MLWGEIAWKLSGIFVPGPCDLFTLTASIMSTQYACRRELSKAVDKGDAFKMRFFGSQGDKFLSETTRKDTLSHSKGVSNLTALRLDTINGLKATFMASNSP